MSDTKVLNETNTGRLTHGGNELLVDALDLDAAKVRLGAPEDQRALGALGGDVLNADGHGRDEVVLIILKQSGDGVPDGEKGGEIYIGCRAPGEGSTDDAMKQVALMFHDRVEFNVPVTAPNLGGGGGGSNEFATGISSRNGKYRLQVQDDGNLVYYDYSVSPPRVLAVLGHK